MLEILYQDQYIVAINKPRDLLVHKSFIASDIQEYAIQILRDQIGQYVYPVHRLDRKTSGVLLFALDKEILKQLNDDFATRKVEKKYIAIVRGYTKDEELIDYALTNDAGQEQEAKTYYKTLQRVEVDIPFGNHLTSRYSLVEAYPETGRQHQLRKHFKHIFHPILGSRPHGCNKQNKMWLDRYGLMAMLLHALELKFTHPITKEVIELRATIDDQYLKYNAVLGFNLEQYY
ncbi:MULTISPECIES: pseudouridine synthase [Myroides]|uniref:tRNA pseudouridine synthase C n=1 Tax=Myroides albus TaxID=2562892 RepID=A0A6I3LGN2_9FLAO|nr:MULTISPECIES: pseudouridine synthase [Myroides]MTG98709.1 pseudouridylate synthase [Myroides albus]MVX35659.1 pseudouridylate synthase [Myroides sp. LoEW2-1]UVD78794.1 pseudouridine synthase [Myroides albus]